MEFGPRASAMTEASSSLSRSVVINQVIFVSCCNVETELWSIKINEFTSDLACLFSHKATAGMSALMSMAPQKAILAETGQVVDARDVQVNTILAVNAGEVIPIDGVVVEGKSEVNEQSLTGESFLVAKQAQSLVWAGTLKKKEKK